MRRRATIRDVARLAGVGVSTVSYVLNGYDDHVASDTREHILAAARQLNYRPNAIARSMVKQKTVTIGVIIAELRNPLFIPITEGVEEVLRREGYQILVASAEDLASEMNVIEAFRVQQVAGFIFMSLSVRYPIDHLLQLREENIPFVIINRDLDDDRFNRIQLDDWSAGFTATEHLIKLGHTRIGTISGLLDGEPSIRRRSAIERQQGWQDALQVHRLVVTPSWIVSGVYTYDGGYRATRKLLESAEGQPLPTALFVASDGMAVGALKAIHDAGLRVPDDIAVIAIGDPPFAAYTIPSLSTMSIPIAESGKVAARILLDWINAGKPLQPQHVTLSFNLEIRESCGARRLA
jgi:LacI family transcriptional regulator